MVIPIQYYQIAIPSRYYLTIFYRLMRSLSSNIIDYSVHTCFYNTQHTHRLIKFQMPRLLVFVIHSNR